MANRGRSWLHACLALVSLLLFAGCEGDSANNNNAALGVTRVIGQVSAPQDGITTSPLVPLQNARVILNDFGPLGSTRTGRTIDLGTTDANGAYNVLVDNADSIPVAAIIVKGAINGNEVRISGLFNPGVEVVEKDLDPETDVACEAGAGLLADGTLTNNELSAEAIDELEIASAELLAQNPINVFDPSAVSASADAIEAEAKDVIAGNSESVSTPVEEPALEEPVDDPHVDDAPPATDPTPPTLASLDPALLETGVPPEMLGTGGCTLFPIDCGDGGIVCLERFCNGQGDCSDGIDEDPIVCEIISGPLAELFAAAGG